MEYKGIDVSKYQGTIDWNKVKNDGIYFAFIRVGYLNSDGTLTIDPYYDINMKNAIASGINVGVYVYSYINTVASSIIGAKNVIEKIKNYKITMPIAFDIEDKINILIDKNTNSEICKAFLSTIKSAGYYPILYTYTNFLQNYLNIGQLKDYDLWIADYRASVGYKGKYTIWQYSSKGSVSGISGNVDMNIMYVDYPNIISKGIEVSENLSDLVYRVLIQNKCQGFLSKNTNDVLEYNGKNYLDVGDYKIINKENYIGEENLYWCEVRLPNGKSCYAVYNLPDNRCEIINIKKDVSVENKKLKILLKNKNQAFLSRDTDNIVKFGESSYIPVGEYNLITMDLEPQEEGFLWCQFKYDSNHSYYAVYGLSDGRCEIVSDNTHNEPEAPEEPVTPPVDDTEIREIKESIDKLNETISALQSSLLKLEEDNKKITSEFEKHLKTIQEKVSAIKNIL